ncbi:30S ribosomal protein S16 [Robiginitalea aurantiaca]|uniref:Small ribosomal subunit protein bS16 n=1 Tax=Robiginitalea aurantiaca TaxID=3056915 RepID=A0ABT7WBL2_9FLAO|nr:30S ribosomal protein S16 [Robiginitalea aurantiaca]MDM9630315.1 30S ribosomal protein S16 [Robiginitalea aurantiaca]
MPVKIRLQRHGKKGKPIYWIVAADVRSKRDGRYLEKLGSYNPNTNPATIDVNVDASVTWLDHGAQPTETARRILSYKGVLMKHHLKGGVRKGALTEEQAEEKFQAWLEEKTKKVADKSQGLEKEKAAARAKALEAEKEVSEKRAQATAEAQAEAEAEAAPEAEAEATPAVEAAPEAAEVETAAEPAAEATEEKAPEAATEAPEEKAPEAAAETSEEKAPDAEEAEKK